MNQLKNLVKKPSKFINIIGQGPDGPLSLTACLAWQLVYCKQLKYLGAKEDIVIVCYIWKKYLNDEKLKKNYVIFIFCIAY